MVMPEFLEEALLKTLADRMKVQAHEHPCDPRQVAAAMMEGKILPFPDNLKGFIVLDDVKHQLQFSHDRLSEGKTLIHLSCAREDQAAVTDSVKNKLIAAFFGGEETFEFPGNEMIARQYVTHIAALRVE
jgi:hypothetical protein